MAVIDLRDGADALRELTGGLIVASGRRDADKSVGVYFVPSDGEFSALARFVEREVFLAWFGNDAVTMDREYDPFEEASEFIVCVDHHLREPAGVIRLLRPNDLGLKTLLDIAVEPAWGTSEADFLAYHRPAGGMQAVVDIATLAVRSGSAGRAASQVSQALYAGLYRWSVSNGTELLIGALDSAVYDLLTLLGIPIEPLCGLPAAEYLGSPSTTPIVISVSEARRRMRVEPELRSLLLGEDLEPYYSMPAIELRGQTIDARSHLFADPTPRR